MDLTRQLLPYGKGGGFNRSAHSAGPGEWKRIKGKEVKGRGKKEYGGGETDKARRMREPT